MFCSMTSSADSSDSNDVDIMDVPEHSLYDDGSNHKDEEEWKIDTVPVVIQFYIMSAASKLRHCRK